MRTSYVRLRWPARGSLAPGLVGVRLGFDFGHVALNRLRGRDQCSSVWFRLHRLITAALQMIGTGSMPVMRHR